jgi:ubiquinone/menaquinone biosynthesis C-methylase UbiE
MLGRDRLSSGLNVDERTVEGFGREWATFTYDGHDAHELDRMFAGYFSIFPWDELPPQAVGFDAGCGSGRWAMRAAHRVGKLHCVDASAEALDVARRNLQSQPNCEFHQASVEAMPLAQGSMDFGYSLGVLHHVPDTEAGLRACVSKLKPGAPFLVYLYYALENRPLAYRLLWRTSDLLRRGIMRLPFPAKYATSQVLAATVYWPIARAARTLEKAGMDVANFPLAAYRDASFYVMRTDALDRFGTRLEQRFTRDQIRSMMQRAGLERVRFREQPPFWCALGYRAG